MMLRRSIAEVSNQFGTNSVATPGSPILEEAFPPPQVLHSSHLVETVLVLVEHSRSRRVLLTHPDSIQLRQVPPQPIRHSPYSLLDVLHNSQFDEQHLCWVQYKRVELESQHQSALQDRVVKTLGRVVLLVNSDVKVQH